MTIMAFDGKSLAVDGRVTMGGLVISDNFNKMYEVDHPQLGPMICAVTGACDFIGPWLQTIAEEGFVPVKVAGMDDDYEMSGLFIDKNGHAWQASSSGGFFHLGTEPCALGSATTLATYLLKKGKTALATVQECSANNLFCGGTIKNFNSKTSKITEHK